jgi:hypothetical protein
MQPSRGGSVGDLSGVVIGIRVVQTSVLPSGLALGAGDLAILTMTIAARHKAGEKSLPGYGKVLGRCWGEFAVQLIVELLFTASWSLLHQVRISGVWPDKGHFFEYAG